LSRFETESFFPSTTSSAVSGISFHPQITQISADQRETGISSAKICVNL
jgi:hypothetical protein